MAHNHSSDNNNGTAPEVVQEMLPFAIYAIIPLALTVLIAYTFGTYH